MGTAPMGALLAAAPVTGSDPWTSGGANSLWATLAALALAAAALYLPGLALAQLLPAPQLAPLEFRVAIAPVLSIVLAAAGVRALGLMSLGMHAAQLLVLTALLWAVVWWRRSRASPRESTSWSPGSAGPGGPAGTRCRAVVREPRAGRTGPAEPGFQEPRPLRRSDRRDRLAGPERRAAGLARGRAVGRSVLPPRAACAARLGAARSHDVDGGDHRCRGRRRCDGLAAPGRPHAGSDVASRRSAPALAGRAVRGVPARSHLGRLRHRLRRPPGRSGTVRRRPVRPVAVGARSASDHHAAADPDGSWTLPAACDRGGWARARGVWPALRRRRASPGSGSFPRGAGRGRGRAGRPARRCCPAAQRADAPAAADRPGLGPAAQRRRSGVGAAGRPGAAARPRQCPEPGLVGARARRGCGSGSAKAGRASRRWPWPCPCCWVCWRCCGCRRSSPR